MMLSKLLLCVIALAALASDCFAAKPCTEIIEISSFSQDHVVLDFPSERSRLAFWITFTDVLWPTELRQGENGHNFARTWGPIIRGEGKSGGLCVCLARRHHCFDDNCRKTAEKLREQGIRLEVIESDISPRKKCERVVVAE